jgi:predicted aspartyl protease
LVRGHIVFKARVEGRDVWALLDTGAQRSIVDIALATAAGRAVGLPEGTIRSSTNFAIPKRRVSNVSISLPNQIDIQSPAVVGMDMSAMSGAMGRKIEFVLGADFLSLMAFKVDPGPQALEFYPSGALAPPPGFPSIPLRAGYGIEILVGDRPVLVELDLGATSALILDPSAWARVGSPSAKLSPGGTRGVDGQVQVVDFTTVPSVKIGSNQYSDVRAKIMPWSNGDLEGAVGMELMDRLFMVLDVRAEKFWLAPRARVASPPADKPGPR